MGFIKYKERIERIDQLIRLKATGSPNQFAAKIGICESRLYEYINLMKAIGAPILYDWELQSYVYIYPVKFISEFTKAENKQINNF